MTQDDYENLAQSFLSYITKYMSENDEIDIKKDIINYITRVNRTIDFKLATDEELYTDIILRTLKEHDYFELSQKTQNVKMYRLAENGKAYFRRMKELEAKINPRPKFFIPSINDKSETLDIWTDLKKLTCTNEKSICNKKVHRLVSKHNGREIIDEIGRITKSNNEQVFAIIETDNRFYVFTPSRGYLKSTPMEVGKQSVIHVSYFDE